MANNQSTESSDEEVQHTCPKCGKQYAHESSLIRHKKSCINEVVFTCSICDKSFGRKDHLDRHTEVCRPKQDYKCEKCSKVFAFQSYLARHKCSWHCSDCGKKLKTQSEPHQCKIFVKMPPKKNKVFGDGSSRSPREKKQSLSTGSYEVPSGFDEIVNVATIYYGLGLADMLEVGPISFIKFEYCYCF